MPAANHKPRLAAPTVCPMRDDERRRTERFFREAGYPVPLGDHVAWGAFEGEDLIGALALCDEAGITILRGPEIRHERRRRGLGKSLMRAAAPALEGRACYVISYRHLVRMYREFGFQRCGVGEGPEFLRRRVRDLNERSWDLLLLFKPA